MKYYKERLSPMPEAYTEIKEEMIDVSDCFKMFIDERCNIYSRDDSYSVASSTFYKDFVSWFKNKYSDRKVPPQLTFNEQILVLCNAHGVYKKKNSSFYFLLHRIKIRSS